MTITLYVAIKVYYVEVCCLSFVQPPFPVLFSLPLFLPPILPLFPVPFLTPLFLPLFFCLLFLPSFPSLPFFPLFSSFLFVFGPLVCLFLSFFLSLFINSHIFVPFVAFYCLWLLFVWCCFSLLFWQIFLFLIAREACNYCVPV